MNRVVAIHSHAMSKKTPTFEEAIDRLEAIVDQIEAGEVGLEEALKRYDEGMKLVSRCRSILDAAEKKITELTADEEGGLIEAESDDEPGADSSAGEEEEDTPF